MSGLTRGPLAPEVYWRRRLVVIGAALLLVLALGRVLGGGSNGSDPTPDASAAQAGAEVSVTPSATAASPTATPSTKRQIRKAKKQAKADRAAQKAAEQAAADAAASEAAASASAEAAARLTEPVGTCGDTDVVVTPTVTSAVAGSDVTIDLELHTRFSPSCTWTVSADTLAVKITSGPDKIWSTQQCPKAVPTQDVVLRRAVSTTVQVVWTSARRSDESCSHQTDWALPGFYHVLAAALAGEPSDDVQFELGTPSTPLVYKTEQPKADKADKTGKSGKSAKNR